jgi:hypothetical protein
VFLDPGVRTIAKPFSLESLLGSVRAILGATAP